MIATLAALVVGLLIASAKSSFDTKDGELKAAAAHVVVLDRTMAEYGPETKDARDLSARDARAENPAGLAGGRRKSRGGEGYWPGFGVEVLQRKLLDLSPQNDAQRWLKSSALQISEDIAEVRWLVVEQTGTSLQWPFLAILVFWLAIIFASFGLFAPPQRQRAHRTVRLRPVGRRLHLSDHRDGPALWRSHKALKCAGYRCLGPDRQLTTTMIVRRAPAADAAARSLLPQQPQQAVISAGIFANATFEQQSTIIDAHCRIRI